MASSTLYLFRINFLPSLTVLLVDELRAAALALTELLRDNGVQHAYIGGFATNMLGSVRSTEDIDVVVQLSPAVFNSSIMPKLLQDHRFNSTREMGGLYFRHPRRNIKVDVIPGGEMETPNTLGNIREGKFICDCSMSLRSTTKFFDLEQGVPLLPAAEIFKLKLNRFCLLMITPAYLQGNAIYREKARADLRDIKHLIEVMEDEGNKLVVDETLRERLQVLENELAKNPSLQPAISKLKNIC